MYSASTEDKAPPPDTGKYVRIGLIILIGVVIFAIVGNQGVVLSMNISEFESQFTKPLFYSVVSALVLVSIALVRVNIKNRSSIAWYAIQTGLTFLRKGAMEPVSQSLSRYQDYKLTVPKAFDEHVSVLRSLAKKFTSTFEISTEYPPCIKHAIEVLDKGENLPHSGRFMLATFLLTKGKNIEQIVPLFKNAPDYNEKVTRYQLEHLAGKTGAGKKYSCPSCDKLRSEDLCFEIPACNNIINPLQFGKKRIRNA